jgi:hypothetical protein
MRLVLRVFSMAADSLHSGGGQSAGHFLKTKQIGKQSVLGL